MGEPGSSLHYLDADKESLITYRGLSLFHRPNWYKGIKKSARLENLVASRIDGGIIHPGEMTRLHSIREKQKRLERKRQKFQERNQEWENRLDRCRPFSIHGTHGSPETNRAIAVPAAHARGTHPDPRGGYGGGQCLHIRASSKCDYGPNRFYVALSGGLATGQEVTIRAKVRWLCGWPEVHNRAFLFGFSVYGLLE